MAAHAHSQPAVAPPLADALADPLGSARLLATRLRARWRADELDGDLAAGADPVATRELAWRAGRLTHQRTRNSLARSLERVVAEAAQPQRALSAAAPLQRRAVRDARPALLSLADELRRTERPEPRGVAMVRRMLSDGTGPLYARAPEGELARRVGAARAALGEG